MKAIFRQLGFILLVMGCCLSAQGSSVLPMTPGELVGGSDAVLRGTVVAISSFRDVDGFIYTRASLRVDEPLKGKFPAVLQVVHRGGQVGGESEFSGFSPQFQPGGEYLLYVTRGGNGRLYCTQGSSSAVRLHRASGQAKAGVAVFDAAGEGLLAEVRGFTQGGKLSGSDVTDQAGENGSPADVLTGMLGGTPARFLSPDRGEPIAYIIDADSLPAGISLAQATNAVLQALNAWAAVTSLKFQFEGFQSFGMAAANVAVSDGKLRIQLHDNYNLITETNVLGKGGRNSSTSPLAGVGWDLGGNVAGNEFQRTTRGYLTLKATHPVMQVLSTFTEVLCHELGHTLNLAHSSEDPNEANTLLKQAMMYFQAHADGRGATLGAYDPPVIQQIYPSNTAPFTYNRMMDCISASTQPSVPGINEVELRGYDLQSTDLILATANPSANNGTFSVVGSKVSFTPAFYFSDSTRSDPAGNSFKDIIYARFSDGTNASPYATIKVLSLRGDGDHPSDGLPDYWMTYYFGHSDPQAGDKSRATDDADGDGLNNLQEFIAGTSPVDATSGQRITAFDRSSLQWQAKAYELYEVLGSTNLTDWARVGNPIQPTNAVLSIRTNLPDVLVSVTASNLPTNGVQRYYRIQKVP